MKRYAIYETRAAADAAVARFDARHRYPHPGTPVGHGRHATAAESVTLRWCNPLKHPLLLQWRVVFLEPDADLVADATQRLDALPDGWISRTISLS